MAPAKLAATARVTSAATVRLARVPWQPLRNAFVVAKPWAIEVLINQTMRVPMRGVYIVEDSVVLRSAVLVGRGLLVDAKSALVLRHVLNAHRLGRSFLEHNRWRMVFSLAMHSLQL